MTHDCRIRAKRELISPPGLEQFFRLIGASDAEQDLDQIAPLAATIDCEVDQDATVPLIARHWLRT